MNVSVVIQNLTQTKVFTVIKGGSLVKGGKKANSSIWTACEQVPDRYSCYYWKDSSRIRYVGSISADYRSAKTNLVGRIGNYFQNHSGKTNKRVFDKVNDLLSTDSVEFGIFRYEDVQMDGKTYSYKDCIQCPAIVKMVEEILICGYRLMGEADWNRS